MNDGGEIFHIRKIRSCGVGTLPGSILPWASLEQSNEGGFSEAFCGFDELLCIPESFTELYIHLEEVSIG